MPGPSLAETYFRDLLARGDSLFAHLDGLGVAVAPTVETEWLDFKSGTNLSDDDVKKYWSKSLAAFATTQGGVLIWGLDCRKSGDPAVDRVIGSAYVSNPDAFKSRLMELHHQATEPPALGIDLRVALDPQNATRGFVICYVPESAFKPLRAEYAGRQFYIRAGDDSVVPSVTLLRSLFVPGSSAELAMRIRVDHWPKEPDIRTPIYINFHADVTNRGLVSATGVLVALAGTDRFYPGEFSVPDQWVRRSTSTWPTSFESPRAIYPGETMTVFSFRSSVLLKQRNVEERVLPPHYEQIFDLRVFADNQPGFRATTRFVENDIHHRITRDCAASALG